MEQKITLLNRFLNKKNPDAIKEKRKASRHQIVYSERNEWQKSINVCVLYVFVALHVQTMWEMDLVHKVQRMDLHAWACTDFDLFHVCILCKAHVHTDDAGADRDNWNICYSIFNIALSL